MAASDTNSKNNKNLINDSTVNFLQSTVKIEEPIIMATYSETRKRILQTNFMHIHVLIHMSAKPFYTCKYDIVSIINDSDNVKLIKIEQPED